MTFDLLHEPLIQTDLGWSSLPRLFRDMSDDKVQGFPGLRPHQRPAWHMFLVQLAVMALDASGQKTLLRTEEDWRSALRSLTADFPNDEPWHLIGTDSAKPAFMQPSDPRGLSWTKVVTPDALDMLITSRNHDLKREIAYHATPQDWIFALISLQTMEGYGGKGNYGTVRMNGGSSSRVMLALAPAGHGASLVNPSAWWARDVLQLLSSRAGLSGKALLWTEPWPEDRSLDLAALDPLFIEVCRRIRLKENQGRIYAERSTSSAERIAGKEAKGNTGDPWAPIHIAESKSLTLGDRDWSHELLVQLLFSEQKEWAHPPLAKAIASEATQPMLLIAEAFARGNSKTDGFKSRIIPIPKAMVREMLGERAISIAPGILEDISTIDIALRAGLSLVAAGGLREKVKAPHYAHTRAPREVLRRHADQMFFPELWARLSVQHDEDFTPLRKAFLERLSKVARDEFIRALPAIPCAALMRPRAEARGKQALERAIAFASFKLKKSEPAHDQV